MNAPRRDAPPDRRPDSRPNILLFGVGHSGTSIVSKMIRALGWNLGEADGFGENVAVRRINAQLLGGRIPERQNVADVVRGLPAPWLLKDPRFVLTLDHWIGWFESFPADERPVLVYLTRDVEKIERTYVAYGEVKNGTPGMYRHSVRELAERAAEGYAKWPFRKIHLTFEQVIDAAKLFNVTRAVRRDAAVGEAGS